MTQTVRETSEWAGLSPPYSTIVADPPWRYRTSSGLVTRGTVPSTAEAHYSTLSNEEIAALPVTGLAADDAHCYLWATNPRLFGERRRGEIGPADILEAWGFRYVTLLTWLKTGTLGMGFYFRGETEHVLFGVRGNLPIPVEKRERNWMQAPRTRHSVKPGAVLDLIERVSPGPYVELFARQPRMGWDSWGDGYEEAVAHA